MAADFQFTSAPRRIVDTTQPEHAKAFSIVTLVTDSKAYRDMCESFARAGFDAHDCEFLTVDNRNGRNVSAYAGLNAAIAEAQGRFLILCHQDVLLTNDRRDQLEARLAELETVDPCWAVAGNAGGLALGNLAIRITDPHGSDQHRGTLPAQVFSVDENFVVLKRSANIGFSADLEGFHFYGADLCAQARIAGHRCYVIDFHLTHLSPGKKDKSFDESRAAFEAKWARALRPRLVQTTCAVVALYPSVRIGRAVGLAAKSKHTLVRRARQLYSTLWSNLTTRRRSLAQRTSIE